ncbi:MAG: hypothetical protein WBN09_11455 [Woeseiaceae bacterium]
MSLTAFRKTVSDCMTDAMSAQGFGRYGRGFRKRFDGGFFLVSYNEKKVGDKLAYCGAIGVRLDAVESYLESYLYSNLVETKHNVTIGGTLPQLTNDSAYRHNIQIDGDFSRCGSNICADINANLYRFDSWGSVENLDSLLNTGDLAENVPGFFVPINRIAVGLITAKLAENPQYEGLESKYVEMAAQLANGFYLEKTKTLVRALRTPAE